MVLTFHSVKVTWDSPNANAELITSYIVSYNAVESFTDDGGNLTVNATNNNTTIDGLEKFISYDITVQAVYVGDVSYFSIPVRVTVHLNGW